MAEKRCMRCGHGLLGHVEEFGPENWGRGPGTILCLEDGKPAAWALPLRPETPRPTLRLVKGGRE